MTLYNIPYNPQSDPHQYFAQGFSNFLAGLNEKRESKQFGQAVGGVDPQAGVLQAIGQMMSGGATPQQAMGVGKMMPTPAPMTIERLRAQEATRTGARPGTEEFEDIAEGRETPESESQFTAYLGRKIAEGTATEEDRTIFEQLTKVPSTTINLGTPSPTERTALAQGRASIDALGNLKTLFDNTQTKTGPLVGRYSPIAGLVGMTTDEQEAFMAATSAFKNAIIKEITGAQMSEQEANRIMKQVPDITDPATRWKAKWEESKKNLEFLQKRRMEILGQSGIRVPGKDNIPDDIKGMSDEELRKLAGIE